MMLGFRSHPAHRGVGTLPTWCTLNNLRSVVLLKGCVPALDEVLTWRRSLFSPNLPHIPLDNCAFLPVGFCWYCASHLAAGISALIASSSSFFQKLGHKGVPEGKIAGNSITSQSFTPSFSEFLRICPVRSLLGPASHHNNDGSAGL
jgi:hypothetical protein